MLDGDYLLTEELPRIIKSCVFVLVILQADICTENEQSNNFYTFLTFYIQNLNLSILLSLKKNIVKKNTLCK